MAYRYPPEVEVCMQVCSPFDLTGKTWLVALQNEKLHLLLESVWLTFKWGHLAVDVEGKTSCLRLFFLFLPNTGGICGDSS